MVGPLTGLTHAPALAMNDNRPFKATYKQDSFRCASQDQMMELRKASREAAVAKRRQGPAAQAQATLANRVQSAAAAPVATAAAPLPFAQRFHQAVVESNGELTKNIVNPFNAIIDRYLEGAARNYPENSSTYLQLKKVLGNHRNKVMRAKLESIWSSGSKVYAWSDAETQGFFIGLGKIYKDTLKAQKMVAATAAAPLVTAAVTNMTAAGIAMEDVVTASSKK